jgi:hypothetical protein
VSHLITFEEAFSQMKRGRLVRRVAWREHKRDAIGLIPGILVFYYNDDDAACELTDEDRVASDWYVSDERNGEPAGLPPTSWGYRWPILDQSTSDTISN